MKHIIFLFAACLLLTACNPDDGPRNDNPNHVEPLVSLNLNLDLPEYNGLNFPGNGVVINAQGIKGIIVYNVNNDLYTAFDLTDPNHPPSSCSRMMVEGIIATCQCDDGNSYDIVTGQHQEQDATIYPMLRYNAIRNGNVVNVSN